MSCRSGRTTSPHEIARERFRTKAARAAETPFLRCSAGESLGERTKAVASATRSVTFVAAHRRAPIAHPDPPRRQVDRCSVHGGTLQTRSRRNGPDMTGDGAKVRTDPYRHPHAPCLLNYWSGACQTRAFDSGPSDPRRKVFRRDRRERRCGPSGEEGPPGDRPPRSPVDGYRHRTQSPAIPRRGSATG